MTDPSPTNEIRAAAARLRTGTPKGAFTATSSAAAILRAREPLADWLDAEAARLAAHLPVWDGTTWLATRTWADPAPVGYQRPDIVRDLTEQHHRHALTIARHINQEQP